jgi:hypothetical protein
MKNEIADTGIVKENIIMKKFIPRQIISSSEGAKSA